jgi:hypothetical protein
VSAISDPSNVIKDPPTQPFYFPGQIAFNYSSITNQLTIPLTAAPSSALAQYPYRNLVSVQVFAQNSSCALSHQVGAFTLAELHNSGATLNLTSIPSLPTQVNLYFKASAQKDGLTHSIPCSFAGYFTYDATAPTVPTMLFPSAVNTDKATITFENIGPDVASIAEYLSADCKIRAPQGQIITRLATQLAGASQLRNAHTTGAPKTAHPSNLSLSDPSVVTDADDKSLTVELPIIGLNTIYIGILDEAGNIACPRVQILRDHTNPTLTQLQLIPGSRASSPTPHLRGDGSGDVDLVKIYLPQGGSNCGAVQASGTLSILQALAPHQGILIPLPAPLGLEEREFKFYVSAVDLAGNESECYPIPYTYDALAPTFDLEVPRFVSSSKVAIRANNRVVPEDLKKISFYSADGKTKIADGTRATLISSGVELSGLKHGIENVFSSISVDSAGNQTARILMPGIIALYEDFRPLSFIETPPAASASSRLKIRATSVNTYETKLQFYARVSGKERCSAHAGDAVLKEGVWSIELSQPELGEMIFDYQIVDAAERVSECFYAFSHVRLSPNESPAKLLSGPSFSPDFPANVTDVAVYGQVSEETAKIIFSLKEDCSSPLLTLTPEQFASKEAILHFEREGIFSLFYLLSDKFERKTPCTKTAEAIIDLTPPSQPQGMSVEPFTNQTTRGARLTFNSPAQDNLLGARYQARVTSPTGTPLTGQSFVDLSGLTYQPSLALESGKSYAYQVRTKDLAGNVSPAVVSQPFLVDTETTLKVSTPSQGALVEADQALVTLLCEPNAQITVTARAPEDLKLSEIPLCDHEGVSKFKVSRPSSNDPILIKLSATDRALNLANASVQFKFSTPSVPRAEIKILSPLEGESLVLKTQQFDVKGSCTSVAGPMSVSLGAGLYFDSKIDPSITAPDDELVRTSTTLSAEEPKEETKEKEISCRDGAFSFALGFAGASLNATSIKISAKNSQGVLTTELRKFSVVLETTQPQPSLKFTSPVHGQLLKIQSNILTIQGTCSGLKDLINLEIAGEAQMIDTKVPCVDGFFSAKTKLTKTEGLAAIDARAVDVNDQPIQASVGFGYQILPKPTTTPIPSDQADEPIASGTTTTTSSAAGVTNSAADAK